MTLDIVGLLVEGIKEQIEEDIAKAAKEKERQETNPADSIKEELKAFTDQFSSISDGIEEILNGNGKSSKSSSLPFNEDTDEESEE